MITNPFLKEIVKKSNRRFITTSMIVEAEKAEWEAKKSTWQYLAPLYQSQKALSLGELAALQIQRAMGQAPMQEGIFGTVLGGALGGFFGGTPARCPRCGK